MDTYDPEANYYYGLINIKLDKINDAKAASGIEYLNSGNTELAKLYFREKKISKVLEYVEKSLESNQYNFEALQLLNVPYRMQKENSKALEMLNKINATDQLNHSVGFKKYYLDDSEKSKEQQLIIKLVILYC